MIKALRAQFPRKSCKHRTRTIGGEYVCSWVYEQGLVAECSAVTCEQFRVAADFITLDAEEVPRVDVLALERYLLREFIARRSRLVGRLNGDCLFCATHPGHQSWCPLAFYERLRQADKAENAVGAEPALAAE